MKILVRQIQEAIGQAEQNIRVVEIVPVSAETNGARGFDMSEHLDMSEHKAAWTSGAVDEMQAG